jgi:uncharacterized protein (TIGR02996 family)
VAPKFLSRIIPASLAAILFSIASASGQVVESPDQKASWEPAPVLGFSGETRIDPARNASKSADSTVEKFVPYWPRLEELSQLLKRETRTPAASSIRADVLWSAVLVINCVAIGIGLKRKAIAPSPAVEPIESPRIRPSRSIPYSPARESVAERPPTIDIETLGYEALIAPARRESRGARIVHSEQHVPAEAERRVIRSVLELRNPTNPEREHVIGSSPADCWTTGNFATLAGEAGELMLHFNCDAQVCYTNYGPILAENRTGQAHFLTPTVRSVRAGEVVRVVDSLATAGRAYHWSAIQSDRCTLHVSPPHAAVQLVNADAAAMAKFFNRSSDDAAFWNAIFERPDEELRRLTYADYLDEHGDSAGTIFRAELPFTLHYCVWRNEQYEERNRRRACWRQVLSDLRAIAAHGDLALELGFRWLAAHRYVPERDETWQLGVSGINGAELPPFVNYLLRQMSICDRTDAHIAPDRTSAA